MLLPFGVLLALSAELLAFLFGGIVRATISWTVLFVAIGLVLGIVVGGEGIAVLPVVMGVTGLLLGVTLGFLCGPIFRGLPVSFDREI